MFNNRVMATVWRLPYIYKSGEHRILNGAHGSITFEDYIYIAASTTVEVRNKLDVNNLTFDDDLNESQLENYLSVQIERIAETDIT